MVRHDPSIQPPNFLEEKKNVETRNPGSTLCIRFVHCCGRFLKRGAGSLAERRKAQPACESVQGRGHADSRWRRSCPATESISLATRGCIKTQTRRGEDTARSSPLAHARMDFPR